MLSAIVTNGDTAEVFFLIALIVFIIAAVSSFIRPGPDGGPYAYPWNSVLVAVGLAFTAAGFLWL
jgi:hypothetical protein